MTHDNPRLMASLRKSSAFLHRRLDRAGVAAFGYTDYQRFVIVAHARTGSNFLATSLKSASDIEIMGEIFAQSERRGRGYHETLAQLYARRWRKVKAVGCKIFYYHLSDEEWQDFSGRDNFKIIHLMRRNRLRTLISLDIARSTDMWTQQSASERLSTAEKRLTIDTNVLIPRIEKIETGETRTRERFSAHPYHEVFYEELTADVTKVVDDTLAFLGISRRSAESSPLRRQNPETLSQLLANYEDVVRTLKGTPYAHYLDEA